MVTVLGPRAINEKKFSLPSTTEEALGIVLDTKKAVVRKPVEKVTNALTVIDACLGKPFITKKDLQSVEATLRFVASCFRPGLAFLQRLHDQSLRMGNYCQRPTLSTKQDLLFWRDVVTSRRLSEGIPMQAFCRRLTADIQINMDASDSGLCASWQTLKEYVRLDFNVQESQAVVAAKIPGCQNGFTINVRELLSCLHATVA